MKLKRWDIVFVPADENDKVGHPGVVLWRRIFSTTRNNAGSTCSSEPSVSPAAAVAEHQVILNGADGLEFQTLIDCSLVYMVKKTSILRVSGSVGHFQMAGNPKKSQRISWLVLKRCSIPPVAMKSMLELKQAISRRRNVNDVNCSSI